MKTILFVEDTQELRDLVGERLQGLGYKVITAQNGMEGLRLFKQYDGYIDAVLTDLEMPMMNGAQLVREIRALNKDVPIIMWSGAENPGVPGLNSFLRKEVRFSEISTMLSVLIELGRAA